MADIVVSIISEVAAGSGTAVAPPLPANTSVPNCSTQKR
jgi:hypothetical protein